MKPWLVICLLWMAGCGQDDLEFPELTGGGACGGYYPGAEAEAADDNADADAIYGIEEGKIFPCIAFETARLGGEDTFIHVADEYLKAKHGASDNRAIVIIVSAHNCPGCAVLMEAVNERVDDFDAAGATFIGVAWCDNLDINDCDFDIDTTELVLASEGWPTNKWPVTNDAEGHLRPEFGDAYPSAIVIRLSDMQVRLVDTAPTAEALLALVQGF